MRFKLIESVIFFFLSLIVGGLFYLQIIHGDYYHRQSTNNRIRVVVSDALRGRILDRRGIVLADNRMAFHLGVIAQDIENKKVLFDYLGRVLNRDPALLERQFLRKKTAPFAPVILAEDIPRELAVKIEEEKFLYPGLEIQQGFQRFYPKDDIGAHILGYVGKIDDTQLQDQDLYGVTPLSIVGKTGIENEYDADLQGTPGGRQIEINSRGRQVRLLGLKDAVGGLDVTLTVDQRLQEAAQELLKGSRGSIVVLGLDRADVLCLVSSPSYDPNVFTNKNKRDHLDVYFKDTETPLLNRAVSGQYPPGSVFKIPLALAALERHKITPSTRFDCPGYMMVGHRKFGCSHVHGVQDLTGALARSCNVYFFHLGELVGAPIIGAYSKAFGLNRPTGIDLPFEASGKLITSSPQGLGWYTGDTLNLSIGQGYTLTTPLQLTVLMAAVANKGVILRPRLVQAVGERQILPLDFSQRPIVRLRDETWDAVEKGLKAVVDDQEGTGHSLRDIKGLEIYGKTGTAQSVHGKPNHAWFAGYTRSPKKENIAFCVFLEYGGSSENAVIKARDLLLKLQTLQII
ncbi:MAG: penicillin-binding protein 2 [Candidatus Omnitrophica bacterium]|nr:penicillin-binding protein 2 [Candidatus Omnitrophota bacterium]